jgi:hypothetical protein
MRETTGAELLSSVVLVLEAGRNIARLFRERILTPADFLNCLSSLSNDMDSFLLRNLAFDLCGSMTMLAISTFRSLALAHLRTTRWFHQQKKLNRFALLMNPKGWWHASLIRPSEFFNGPGNWIKLFNVLVIFVNMP